jgi:hypothetical protein
MAGDKITMPEPIGNATRFTWDFLIVGECVLGIVMLGLWWLYLSAKEENKLLRKQVKELKTKLDKTKMDG